MVFVGATAGCLIVTVSMFFQGEPVKALVGLFFACVFASVLMLTGKDNTRKKAHEAADH